MKGLTKNAIIIIITIIIIPLRCLKPKGKNSHSGDTVPGSFR